MSSLDQDEIAKTFGLLKIPKNHATVGFSNMVVATKQYRSLFVNRRLGDAGWSDVQIQSFIFLLSTLDTNNKATTSGGGSVESRWCGVGEREGRVYSSLVAHRHFGLSHGMGRSGDITEPQPKAAGSSVLVKLALLLVLDVVRRGSGLNGKAKGPAAHGILLPLCTGMTMALVLSCIREAENDNKKTIVLWSRIDQKSCFKAITSAGLTCIVVPTKLDKDSDSVITDMEAMEAAIKEHEGKVLAIITTTSCFAPRVPDQVDKVATLCAEHGVNHIINNAYGLQCPQTCKLINRACVVGRVDAIVSSTDKNFLVPVGGALVLSPQKALVQGVGKVYAGRASSSPILDLFITLLSMGMNGYKGILAKRQDMLQTFPTRLEQVATKYGERILKCPTNTISFGITLDNLALARTDDEREEDYLKAVAKDISAFGSMLFSRCVSGTRVVPRAQSKMMGGHEFVGFGSSVEGYPHAYMTAACAVGLTTEELDEFFLRLDKTLQEKHNNKQSKRSSLS
ncbi:phosphoseryl-tRNA(Sec) selenium transferase [Seminavis robusta]|uniref:O-phosphoseryl-tRNA(Sec) selenium transferase n=1 Tax=Seminavis robusta TaxID=568900 RepID=A0A9N8HGL7_9STRA|nr:phosphoseryl-tRNA(Sec) selenium transferase [Seminavis robusta]|eukprot:Sro643_g180420.1 phosphoseryl-tRNA(Sec) selenium transferase (511) ;mRNA; r:50914-52548